ncbi:MAG: DUF4838 domain-containing protein [Armatimonadota bacterium]
MARDITLSLMLLAVAVSAAHAELVLAQGGRTEYAIVTAAAPSVTEELAARELQRYIHAATGAELPVVAEPSGAPGARILLTLVDDAPGTPAIAPGALGDEGFAIRTAGDDLYLIGARPRSLLYAVYWFLRDYVGLRFYCFDDERIPQLDELRIATIDRIERPAFAYRGLKGWSPVGTQWHWMSKMGMNYVQSSMGFSRGGIEPERYREFVAEKTRWDMMWDFGGHYTLALVPPEEHFEEHSEWYSLILSDEQIERLGDRYYSRDYDVSDGQRQPVQICSSSPGAVGKMVNRFLELVDTSPDADVFAPWYSDGVTYCQCPGCVRERDWLWLQEHPSLQHWVKPHQVIGTKQLLQAMNPLAEAMARQAPDRKLFTIAYVNTVPAPREIMPHPNLNMQFAMFHRCYSRPLDGRGDENCHEVNEYFDQNLQRWVELCEGDVIIYYYACAKSAMDGRVMPFPHIIAGDLKHFRRIGVGGVVSQHAWPWAFNLNAYTLARMLWDPSLTADAIIDEYCRRYGEAAGDMKRYFLAMEDAMTGLHHPEYLGDNWTGPPARRMAKMLRAMRLMDEAQSALDRAMTQGANGPAAKAIARDRDLFTWTRRSFEIWHEYARARLFLARDRMAQAEASYERVVAMTDALEEDYRELDIHHNLYRKYRYCRNDLAERGLGGPQSGTE